MLNCTLPTSPIYATQTGAFLGATVNGVYACHKVAANGGMANYKAVLTSTDYTGSYDSLTGAMSLTSNAIECMLNGTASSGSAMKVTVTCPGSLMGAPTSVTGPWQASK